MSRLKDWWREWWDAVLSIAVVALLIILVIVYALKTQEVAYDGPADTRFSLQDDPDISAKVTMDRVTGVYYAIFESANGLEVTPLLLPDGTPERVDKADIAEVIDDIKRNEDAWLRGDK